jgi:glyoxylase-like metal-dependent hydrolase (beta-lactamase superfamily II)
MQELWGEVAPVAADRIVALAGGERLDVGGREIRVAYTPGHAVHHVSYFDVGTAVAFTGDTVGGRYDRSGPVVPFTPPPDIDLAAWRGSLRRIRDWRPAHLFLTHFGFYTDVAEHMAEHEAELFRWAEQVRNSFTTLSDDDARATAFATDYAEKMEWEHPALAEHYSSQAGAYESWLGLARYLRAPGNA